MPSVATSVEPVSRKRVSDDLRRLQPQFPVGVADSACLAYRFAASSCSACIEACPSGGLAIVAQRLELTGDCLRCGRCQAECPTGAAAVAGFALANDAFAAPEIRVVCWKSPRRATAPDDAIRVPCVFGLAAAEIVGLRASSLPRPLHFVDHGWCAGCRAGRGQSLAGWHAELAGLMRDCGLPEELQPRLQSIPLPASTMPASIPDAAGQRAVGRRAFFAGVLRESLVPAALAATAQEAAATVPIRPGAIALAARSVLIGALSRLAEGFGRPGPAALPARLFARVSVGPDCANHGVCASHCPTGALSRWSDGGASGLRFDSLACIACSQCQTVCPEGALRLEPGVGYQTVTELTRVEHRSCCACGGEISQRPQGDSAADLCGNCCKSRRLARSAFSELFGARA